MQAADDMDPERLTTQDYWATLYAKAAKTDRRSVWMDLLKKGVPAPIRRLRKRLMQRHWSRLLFEVLLRPHLEGRSGLKGLEIGSAPGYRSLALWRRFGLEPHGLEYTAEGVRAQRALYRANGLSEDLVVHGDFFDDAWRARWAGAFDLVASYGFIEHFDRPEDVVAKHLELVRPGGLLVVTVPHLNESTAYGRLVRRFNPAVYALHNVRTCTREPFRRVFEGLACDVIHCGPLGGCDVEFDPDRRWTSRAVARFFRMVNPAVNVANHLLVGMRLMEFSRTSSVLALVAVKR